MSMIPIPGESRLYYDTASRLINERQENGDFNPVGSAASLPELPGSAYLGEIANLDDSTRVQLDFPNGIWAFKMQYRGLAASAGTRAFVVRNAQGANEAAKDADADAKLASASTREAVYINDTLPTVFVADSLADLIYRIDIIGATNETGTSIITHSAVGNAP
jgi:hypothetical protein